jgi:sortase B
MNSQGYDDLRNMVATDTHSAEEGIWINSSFGDDMRNENGILVAFESLVAKFPFVKGWIEVPGTRINYPVVQPLVKDNNFFIHSGIDGKYNPNGSIFFDYRMDLSTRESALTSRNLVIYGHHMRSGAMFADLLKYDSLSFYKKTPVIRMDTIYDRGQWVVISVMKCTGITTNSSYFDYTQVKFENGQEFDKFIEAVKSRSIVDTPYTANENDQIITLQTCSYERKDYRTIVVARKLRRGEDKIDVSSAKAAENVVFPKGFTFKMKP